MSIMPWFALMLLVAFPRHVLWNTRTDSLGSIAVARMAIPAPLHGLVLMHLEIVSPPHASWKILTTNLAQHADAATASMATLLGQGRRSLVNAALHPVTCSIRMRSQASLASAARASRERSFGQGQSPMACAAQAAVMASGEQSHGKMGSKRGNADLRRATCDSVTTIPVWIAVVGTRRLVTYNGLEPKQQDHAPQHLAMCTTPIDWPERHVLAISTARAPR
mmetsp:Transcript_41102/g.103213  ORF Transcript_41102/g.103213 Transcript_41102/m.103213 type:complete len:222 (-) Transcript_41102:603-1268(-)